MIRAAGSDDPDKSTAACTFNSALDPNLDEVLYLQWTPGSTLDLVRQLAPAVRFCWRWHYQRYHIYMASWGSVFLVIGLIIPPRGLPADAHNYLRTAAAAYHRLKSLQLDATTERVEDVQAAFHGSGH